MSENKFDMHEDLTRPTVTRQASPRSFGFGTGLILVVMAFWVWRFGIGFSVVLGVAACVLIVLAAVRPLMLVNIQQFWDRATLPVQRVANYGILAIIFFIVLTPIALGMRLFGRDYLRLKLDRGGSSYWVVREPPGPDPQSLKHQF